MQACLLLLAVYFQVAIIIRVKSTGTRDSRSGPNDAWLQSLPLSVCRPHTAGFPERCDLFHFQGLESSFPHHYTTTLTNTDADAARAQQCLAVQAAAPKVTASSVADKDGALGTRYFEVTASPSPSSGRRSRPPASLACFTTDRPPALPAPRSWHSLRSVGFGLGLRCLVPSGHGHVSLALVAEFLLSLQPSQGWPSTAWETRGEKSCG